MTTASERVEETIENVAEIAADAVENAEEAAADMAEQAGERIAAAEAAAQAITDAAMLTELGRQVQETNTRAETWRQELSDQNALTSQELASLRAQLTEMATLLQAATAPPPVVMVTDQSSTPASLPEEVQEIAAAVTDPLTAQLPDENTVLVVPKRRQTRLI